MLLCAQWQSSEINQVSLSLGMRLSRGALTASASAAGHSRRPSASLPAPLPESVEFSDSSVSVSSVDSGTGDATDTASLVAMKSLMDRTGLPPWLAAIRTEAWSESADSWWASSHGQIVAVWQSAAESIAPRMLVRIQLKSAWPVCHCIRPTAFVSSTDTNAQDVDLLMGLSSGEIIFMNPYQCRYRRLNKEARLHAAVPVYIQWLDKALYKFIVVYADGMILSFDLTRLDSNTKTTARCRSKSKPWSMHIRNSLARPFQLQLMRLKLTRKKRHQPYHLQSSKNPQMGLWLKPSNASTISESSQNGSGLVITSALSRDGSYLALSTSTMDTLIVDYTATDPSRSTAGSAQSVATQSIHVVQCPAMVTTCLWSPCTDYLILGGQNDRIYIYSMIQRRIFVECHGHQSWIRALSIDMESCVIQNGRMVEMRLMSVGDDRRLCCWTVPLDGSVSIILPETSVIAHHFPISDAILVGRTLVTSSSSGEMKCWTFDSGNKTQESGDSRQANNGVERAPGRQ